MRWTPPADGGEVPPWKSCNDHDAGDVRDAGHPVGLDLAKNLFQVHGADAQGRPVLKRRLARGKVLEFFANLPPWSGWHRSAVTAVRCEADGQSGVAGQHCGPAFIWLPSRLPAAATQ